MVEIQRKKSWREPDGISPGWGFWRGFLMLECPIGHRNRISLEPDGHKVAADGTVTPSLVCPGGGEIGKPFTCTWHENARLIGWKGDESREDSEGP